MTARDFCSGAIGRIKTILSKSIRYAEKLRFHRVKSADLAASGSSGRAGRGKKTQERQSAFIRYC